jgi:peptide/nickel transport system substrate-binding protein
VKWHDGVPFTADDVVYSLDKMTDVNRSAISDYFPAYQNSEMVDDYTVKVHLKYASAGFMISLASGEAVIQAKHLAGTDDQSADFMIGTGPFILEEYLTRVDLKWKRNPDYWKKDQYGNQLPYLDGLVLYNADNTMTNDMLIARRLDLKGPVTGAATLDTYQYLTQGAPELLWQKRDRDICTPFFINTSHPPLDDVRIRRAMALVLVQKDVIIGYSGDPMFGVTDIGVLQRSFGLPAEEIRQLMGWDKSMEERVAEAQQLMAEAGYADGFKLNMLSRVGTGTAQGASLVFAQALSQDLKIETEVHGLTGTEVDARVSEDNYDVYAVSLQVGQDPIMLKQYFGTDGYANFSHYSNAEIDQLLADLDHIINPEDRRETVWDIERILLTDLPVLPTGTFTPNYMPYYPYVKNARWTDMTYSNICRFEDVWIDRDVYKQIHGSYPSAEILTSTPTPTPTPTATPEPTPTTTSTRAPEPSSTPASTQTAGNPYDDPNFPVLWVSIDPPEGVGDAETEVTVTLKVPPGALCELTFLNPNTGTRSSRKPTPVVADVNGNAVLGPWRLHQNAHAGTGTLEVTVTKTDGTQIVVTHPYILK